jgi:hypothetical protein
MPVEKPRVEYTMYIGRLIRRMGDGLIVRRGARFGDVPTRSLSAKTLTVTQANLGHVTPPNYHYEQRKSENIF